MSCFKSTIPSEFVEKPGYLYLCPPSSPGCGLTVPRVRQEELCVACGWTVRHEFVSIKVWIILQNVVWKRCAMAAFGGHVVWHVLCRRDKVRGSLLASGSNAKTTCVKQHGCPCQHAVTLRSSTFLSNYTHFLAWGYCVSVYSSR